MRPASTPTPTIAANAARRRLHLHLHQKPERTDRGFDSAIRPRVAPPGLDGLAKHFRSPKLTWAGSSLPHLTTAQHRLVVEPCVVFHVPLISRHPHRHPRPPPQPRPSAQQPGRVPEPTLQDL
jgi:hypothetical protein